MRFHLEVTCEACTKTNVPACQECRRLARHVLRMYAIGEAAANAVLSAASLEPDFIDEEPSK